MLYENFVWTSELTQEFNKVILDNYHCIDDVDVATLEFVKSKNNVKTLDITHTRKQKNKTFTKIVFMVLGAVF